MPLNRLLAIEPQRGRPEFGRTGEYLTVEL